MIRLALATLFAASLLSGCGEAAAAPELTPEQKDKYCASFDPTDCSREDGCVVVLQQSIDEERSCGLTPQMVCVPDYAVQVDGYFWILTCPEYCVDEAQ